KACCGRCRGRRVAPAPFLHISLKSLSHRCHARLAWRRRNLERDMFARTDRLLLRPGWAEDAPALHAAIAEPAVVRNLARAPWPYRLTDAQAFLAGADTPLPTCL